MCQLVSEAKSLQVVAHNTRQRTSSSVLTRRCLVRLSIHTCGEVFLTTQLFRLRGSHAQLLCSTVAAHVLPLFSVYACAQLCLTNITATSDRSCDAFADRLGVRDFGSTRRLCEDT